MRYRLVFLVVCSSLAVSSAMAVVNGNLVGEVSRLSRSVRGQFAGIVPEEIDECKIEWEVHAWIRLNAMEGDEKAVLTFTQGMRRFARLKNAEAHQMCGEACLKALDGLERNCKWLLEGSSGRIPAAAHKDLSEKAQQMSRAISDLRGAVLLEIGTNGGDQGSGR